MAMPLARQLVRAVYRAQQLALLVNSVALDQTARTVARRLHLYDRPTPPRAALRRVRQRYFALLDRDLANVEQGLYPRDLLFQIPFGAYLRALPALIRDAPRVVRRMRAGDFRDLPADAVISRYPPYYRRTFHWQTDGYLSRRSAEIYDLGVEILFRGAADVMRRQVIPPITRHLRGPLADRDPGTVRLLDVACGTGRTLAQLAVAHPALRFTGLDLSPYYLQVAREVLAGTRDLSLVADNAEAMPFVSDHFDVATSVYLFHELPRNARRNVLREAYRVLAPGGLLVLEDSVQLSDSPDITEVLGGFSEDFHEPFYRCYLRDDLAAAAAECGFEVLSSEVHLVAKVVVARKPGHARASQRQ